MSAGEIVDQNLQIPSLRFGGQEYLTAADSIELKPKSALEIANEPREPFTAVARYGGFSRSNDLAPID